MAERTPLSELLIVDADVHVHESPGALVEYCDGPWDVALRAVADVPERYLDIPGFSPGGDGTLTARFPTSHEATRMVHTPEQMVADLRAIHVDLAVLFPDHLLKIAELPRHSTSHTFAIIANIVSMVTTGVPVRFPELRIGVTEAGISWMPFVCNRLDKEYLERRREVPFLTERPSHYVKRVYVATQP